MTDDPPIPAATLVVMRPGAGGRARHPGRRARRRHGLCRRRDRLSRRAHRPRRPRAGRRLGRPDDAAKITAIRETIEESAVAGGARRRDRSRARPALQARTARRRRLRRAARQRIGLSLDLDALTPFARWMPAFKQARRFDTLFFLAPALPGDWQPLPQPGECQSAEWAGAAGLLDRIAAGTATPSSRPSATSNGSRCFADIDEARADAAAHSLDTIIPWVEQRDGEPHVCIPDDRGYPVTSRAARPPPFVPRLLRGTSRDSHRARPDMKKGPAARAAGPLHSAWFETSSGDATDACSFRTSCTCRRRTPS